MLIRSQNRKFIVNLQNVDCLGITDDGDIEINAFNGAAETLLGFYSAEEKAIKVLDKIQDMYASSFPPVKVFQMPADEEVTL